MPDLKYPTAKLPHVVNQDEERELARLRLWWQQLTAATCIDRRTIILDWSGRKLGRLCKWRLAAKAQHKANVADILESGESACRFAQVRDTRLTDQGKR